MTTERIEALVAELLQNYPGAVRAQDAGRILVKLPLVEFPTGCQPTSTEALVILTPGAPKPDLMVRVTPRLPSGAQPKTTATTVAGETWYAYSFNLQWDADRHSAVQFVQGKLRRFALNA
jgi:hypothetical protein